MVWIRCLMRPELGPVGEKFGWGERLGSTVKLLPVFFTFVAVIGGIYGGIVTPTEAAAVGVAALLLIALVMRRITWAALGKRSEEHTSEIQSLMRLSYAVFCL